MSDPASQLTYCPICLEVYTSPRALPCLHTFCQLCLEEYIVASANRGQLNHGFECPVCRRPTDPPSTDHHTKWASQFELNHIIISLMESAPADTKKNEADTSRVDSQTVDASISDVNETAKPDPVPAESPKEILTEQPPQIPHWAHHPPPPPPWRHHGPWHHPPHRPPHHWHPPHHHPPPHHPPPPPWNLSSDQETCHSEFPPPPPPHHRGGPHHRPPHCRGRHHHKHC